jgi:hypothetical protein
MELRSLKAHSPVTVAEVMAVSRAFTPAQRAATRLGEVDLNLGVGTIDGRTRCFWTRNGERIEIFSQDDGGYGATFKRGRDPHLPAVLAQPKVKQLL